jgi:hypothetical protein
MTRDAAALRRKPDSPLPDARECRSMRAQCMIRKRRSRLSEKSMRKQDAIAIGRFVGS